MGRPESPLLGAIASPGAPKAVCIKADFDLEGHGETTRSCDSGASHPGKRRARCCSNALGALAIILVAFATALLTFRIMVSGLEFFFNRVVNSKVCTRPSKHHHVPSSPGIFWSPCPDDSETFCSYLSVPLDYAEPSGAAASIALRMIPASAPLKDQLGYVLINPGGPGGSGHAFALRRGKEISTVLKHRYHVIGFDPRGVNLTGPSNDCFANQGDASRLQKDFEALGLPAQTAALAKGPSGSLEDDKDRHGRSSRWQTYADAVTKAFDQSCRQNGNHAVLATSSTATVARDMKFIIEALGQPKLVYWGFSYGTILGATFAAMFPDLVGRLWLDGVSDSQTYTNDIWAWGRSGMNNSQDVWSAFFVACAESGPKGCALAEKGLTALEIEEKIRKLILGLNAEPVIVGSSKYGPGVVRAAQVHYKIWTALYAPKSWPVFAEALDDLIKGNGTALFELANAENDKLARTDSSDNLFHRKSIDSFWSSSPIMCSDTDPAVAQTLSDPASMASYTQSIADISPSGAHWAQWVGACRLWSSKAREVYRGPWTVETGLKKTNHPVVFFSMESDPVTPEISARKMADGFGKDSATFIVQRKGLGHCSSAHPSLCTAKLIRSYFLDGTVPEYGTECDTDDGFLFPHPEKKWQPKIASVEDRELADAIYALGMKGAVGMEDSM
ncbi:BZ3500_MvSof-1268-A1-R1_Chr2-2g05143 [Microbotryum saponariae]|uniref:BZ3500_MvSof-1268-A1-R1_Chr2-2g05143 protein n=1 Tax=Microbotryum saponariae TaxID=289078 RepID=A0A2X0K6H8_9BASI|nr:BZ3500_MvSof-1268-A1-R1_Chr2-2g05143 [Microbotryum saponariae]SDA00970.1 BZ3501_MvSof-1269-A2-R1_Chr2-2g04817 [Microbotryum saponariae]